MLKPNEQVSWHPANQFYELLFLYYQDIMEARKSGDVEGMLNTFDEVCILVTPYLEKYMTKEDEEMFINHDDIYELEDQYKPNNTTQESKHNNKLLQQMIQLINKKRKRLSHLMKDAKMHLPTVKNYDPSDAVLGTR